MKKKMKIKAVGLMLLLLAASCAKAPVYEPWCDQWQILVRDALTGDGKVSASYEGAWHRGDMTPDKYGNRPHYEAVGARMGILELHPVSVNEPAKLQFKGTLTSQAPVLVVQAGGNIHGDCLLQCYANDEKVGEVVLDGLKWTTCAFDLSAYADKPVKLVIMSAAGGADPWKYEQCYIDDISFKPASTSRSL